MLKARRKTRSRSIDPKQQPPDPRPATRDPPTRDRRAKRGPAWLLALAALGCPACAPRAEFAQVRADWTPDARAASGRPAALLFWAPWRRGRLPLLQAFDRLARQRGAKMDMAAVCIVEDAEDLAALDLSGTESVEHYAWKQPLSAALEKIGVFGLPALLVFDNRGRPLHRLAASDLDGRLEIADLADAIEAAAPPDPRLATR